MDISVVVPVYNESENINKLVEKLNSVLSKTGKEYECLFVDDGSRDDSYEVLKELKKKNNFIEIVKLKKNFGQTAAMAAGFDHAKGEKVITIDADLQNDPEDIPMLLDELDKGFDIVSGWRDKRQDPLFSKKIPSFIANKIISWLTGVKLHDFGCTLKVYRKSILKNVKLYGEMHRFIPAIASYSGARIAEVKVKHHPRMYGYSKYGIARTLKVLLDLITVKFFLSYSTSPMQIFGLLGFLLMIAGCVAASITVAMKCLSGTDMTGNPFLYLSILFVIAGIQFIFMGILGEIMVRIYHESQNKQVYTVE